MDQTSVRRAPDRRFERRGIPASRSETATPIVSTIHRVVRSTENVDLVEVVSAPGILRTALRLIVHSIATFVTVLAGSLALLSIAPIAMGYRSVVVSSGSMEPSLDVADAVVIDLVQDDLSVGTVIDYRVAAGTSQIHRIIEVTETGYRTKGDANPSADNAIVSPGDVHGAGVMVVPFAGLPSWLAATKRWPQLALLVITLAVSAHLSRRRWLDAPATTVLQRHPGRRLA